MNAALPLGRTGNIERNAAGLVGRQIAIEFEKLTRKEGFIGTKEELEKKRHLVPEWHAKGNAALGVMQTHLAHHDWFAGQSYSIADIALYGYTHCAGDGGFDLSAYPAVTAWLKRVASQPGHVALEVAW